MSLIRPDQIDQYPVAADPNLPEEVEQHRFRGYAGGIISQHRAMLSEPFNASKVVASMVLVIVAFEGWLLAMDWVATAWAEILDFWRQVFGWNGYVVLVDYPLGFTVPYLTVGSGLPSTAGWLFGALLAVILFTATFFIPRRYLPIAYLFRIVAFFQACAQVFFLFWPRAFPYGASGYVHGMLIAGLILITLIPILLGFTFYIFDFGLSKKIALTALIMVHLSILIPMQYMAHAYILHNTSLLYLPLLFFVFGLPLDVLVFIGFYSWGASWKSLWFSKDVGPEPRVALEAREVA